MPCFRGRFQSARFHTWFHTWFHTFRMRALSCPIVSYVLWLLAGLRPPTAGRRPPAARLCWRFVVAHGRRFKGGYAWQEWSEEQIDDVRRSSLAAREERAADQAEKTT